MQEVTTYTYMNIWNPLDGEILVFTLETNNTHYNYTVSIMRNSYVVDHVHVDLSKPFSNLLFLPGSTILCTVTGKLENLTPEDLKCP